MLPSGNRSTGLAGGEGGLSIMKLGVSFPQCPHSGRGQVAGSVRPAAVLFPVAGLQGGFLQWSVHTGPSPGRMNDSVLCTPLAPSPPAVLDRPWRSLGQTYSGQQTAAPRDIRQRKGEEIEEEWTEGRQV